MDNLYERLICYGNSDYYGFHMPGHKRNPSVTGAGLPYEIDITEIEGFDDLHHARGILKQAQEQAAKLFRGDETCFLVNGSTVGILSAILGVTQKGDRILIARNCHKSVYHAVYMNELRPVYVYPRREGELNGEIDPEEVRKLLERNQALSDGGCRIRAVVITSPTFDGVISDVARIADITHQYGIPLIVDEAHGAHFGFDPYFPKNANTKRADIVIHSIHKTLPALTQTALIHMNGEIVDRDRIKRYLHMLQSSSPSYILMAGIDACMRWLDSEKSALAFEHYTAMLRKTRDELKKMRYLRLIETENFDFSKILISVKGTGYSGKQLYKELLETYHLQMEMAAGSYVLAMTSVGDTEEGFVRLVQALQEIDRSLCEEKHLFERYLSEAEQGIVYGLPKMEQICSPAEIEQMGRKHKEGLKVLPWECCQGKVSMEYAYIYPPGIPLIVPGEKISEEVIALFQAYRKTGFQVEGLEKEGYIKTAEF